MYGSRGFHRFAIVSATALVLLGACRAPFAVRVSDFRGGARPAFYRGEALRMDVQWGAEDKDKAVSCQILDTFSGRPHWRGTAIVPEVRTGSLTTLAFEPPLPEDGQFDLASGAYQWVCDLEDYKRSWVDFDIISR